MPNTNTAEGSRVAVLTLASLAERLRELSARAWDVTDRNTGETDAELAAVLSYMNGLADSCVWAAPGDYEDEAGVERLGRACEEAGKAWTFLHRGGAAEQRKLRAPSPEDLAFIRERLSTKGRNWCRVTPSGAGVLEMLTVPGTSWKLGTVLFSCANLAQARRVLRAVGLEPEAGPDSEALAVLGSFVEVVKP